MGDPNGVGPELLLQVLSDPRVHQLCTPVIFGSGRVLAFYRNQLGLQKFNYQVLAEGQEIQPKKVYLVETSQQFEKVQPGTPDVAAGVAAFHALEVGTRFLQQQRIHALVTLPIDKATVKPEGATFSGHTEYLAQAFGVKDNVMLMVHQGLRVALATGHIAIKEVPGALNPQRILTKLKLLQNCLRVDFNISRPKIAVLGLNPHAGDNGLMGNEEQQVIARAMEMARKDNLLVFGPYSADGFFATHAWRQYDAVLAMYHDQGLIPFKTISGFEGVNFTAGMPAIRTSPDHGTAYGLAGKGTADASSVRAALYLAIDAWRNRQDNLKLLENAMKEVNMAEFFTGEDSVLMETEEK